MYQSGGNTAIGAACETESHNVTTRTDPQAKQTETVGSAPERVREAVVEAARRLFSERGIHAVSVREIAREVGVSHTLLHLYFGNKDEIVRQVLGRFDSSIATALTEAEDLEATVGEVFVGMAKDPALTRVLSAALVEGIVPDRIEAQGHAQEALLSRLQADGPCEIDPRVLTAMLSAAAIGWAVASDWLLDEVGIADAEREHAVEQGAELLRQLVRTCRP